MEMTDEEKKIFEGLSDHSKYVMGFSRIIMKHASNDIFFNGWMPEWISLKIDYLRANGFSVSVSHRKKGLTVESDISKASFRQKLEIWGLN